MGRISSRLEKVERAAKSDRSAMFFVHSGKASGVAYWNNKLKWDNLGKRELEQLTGELEGEGVEVKILNIVAVSPDGTTTDGWGEKGRIEDEESYSY